MNKKKNSLGFNNKDLFSCSLVWRMTALADQVSLGSAGQFCCVQLGLACHCRLGPGLFKHAHSVVQAKGALTTGHVLWSMIRSEEGKTNHANAF